MANAEQIFHSNAEIFMKKATYNLIEMNIVGF